MKKATQAHHVRQEQPAFIDAAPARPRAQALQPPRSVTVPHLVDAAVVITGASLLLSVCVIPSSWSRK